jgi:hypothetical protein
MKLSCVALITLLLLLSGCCEKQLSVPDLNANKKCYTFNRTLSIELLDLNSTHGAISWEDATKIEYFLRAKKEFNEKVEALNSK